MSRKAEKNGDLGLNCGRVNKLVVRKGMGKGEVDVNKQLKILPKWVRFTAMLRFIFTAINQLDKKKEDEKFRTGFFAR